MPLRRIQMIVQYDGAPFQGWQLQGAKPTVQLAIEGALEQLLGRPARIFVAGRTDSGVHAAAMPLHFDIEHTIRAENLPIALTKFLPPAISILSASDVPQTFDVRRSAILRWYRYQVLESKRAQPLGPRAWNIHFELEIEAIERGLRLLRGTHDFDGFRSGSCQSKRTRLTMEQATVTRAGAIWAFDFKCRSFLHHMVRFLVGTLVALGRGRFTEERLLRIRDGFERPQLAYCAPPQGLCLMGVAYKETQRREMLEAAPLPPSF